MKKKSRLDKMKTLRDKMKKGIATKLKWILRCEWILWSKEWMEYETR